MNEKETIKTIKNLYEKIDAIEIEISNIIKSNNVIQNLTQKANAIEIEIENIIKLNNQAVEENEKFLEADKKVYRVKYISTYWAEIEAENISDASNKAKNWDNEYNWCKDENETYAVSKITVFKNGVETSSEWQ